MTNPQFHRFVVIEAEHPGLHRVVGSVREAAECLLWSWPPEERRERYTLALQECRACLEGKTTMHAARWAFIGAAKEAGTFVREDRR